MDIAKNLDPCSPPTIGSSNRPMTAEKETIVRIAPVWSINVTTYSTPEDSNAPAADGLADRDDQTNRPQQDFRPVSKERQGGRRNNLKTEASPHSTGIF